MTPTSSQDAEGFRLIFIVNGVDVPVTMRPEEPLHDGMGRALQISGNNARSLTEWELRDERGRLLDPSKSPGAYGFEGRTRLFLTIRVGAGGGWKRSYQCS
jgi:hypothetical protein